MGLGLQDAVAAALVVAAVAYLVRRRRRARRPKEGPLVSLKRAPKAGDGSPPAEPDRES